MGLATKGIVTKYLLCKMAYLDTSHNNKEIPKCIRQKVKDF